MSAKSKKSKAENINPSDVVLSLSPKGKRVLIALLENAIQAIESDLIHDASSLGVLAQHLGRFAVHVDATVEEPIIKFDRAVNNEWFDDNLSEAIQGQHKAFWKAIGYFKGATKVGAS